MQRKEMAEEYGLSERTVKYHRTVLTRRIDRYASVDLPRLADRLFLFLIRDSRHDTILFQGQTLLPSKPWCSRGSRLRPTEASMGPGVCRQGF
jgi:hypothetical protein